MKKGNYILQKRAGLHGRDLFIFAKIPSTNTWIIDNSEELRHGDTIQTMEQTSGHGRFQRTWHAPANTALLMSVAIDLPALPPDSIQWLSLAAAISIQQALDSSGINASLKWPNDILVDDRKISGILVETTTGTDIAALGMGLNINQREDMFPPEIRKKATSVFIASGKQMDIAEIRILLVRKLERNLSLLIGNNITELYNIWIENDSFPGKEIEVTVWDRRFRARYEGITKDGRLQITCADGKHQIISAGDASLA